MSESTDMGWMKREREFGGGLWMMVCVGGVHSRGVLEVRSEKRGCDHRCCEGCAGKANGGNWEVGKSVVRLVQGVM